MPQAHLPTQCRRCARVRLQPVRPGEATSCRSCGTDSVVLPSPTYAEEDVSLFERIEDSVHASNISQSVAERVVWELSDVPRRNRAPESVLLRVADFVPTIQFLIPVLHLKSTLALERHLLTRATGMLFTIVSARLRRLELEKSQAHG